MRISDWSSDVCSSDLGVIMQAQRIHLARGVAHEHFGPVVIVDIRARADADDRPAFRTALDEGRVAAMLVGGVRSEEHTSELQSLMRISYAVFCLKKKKKRQSETNRTNTNHKPQVDIYIKYHITS